MKLSRTTWLVLVIGILVIAFVGLYMVYLQQGREQEQLNEALAVAQKTLPTLAAERADLEGTLTEIESQLAQAKSRLNLAKAAFPTGVESIEIDEQLFLIANDNDLDIINLAASEPTEEEVAIEGIEMEAVTYLVTSFTLEVRGEVSDILNFIDTVVTHKDFTTAAVESVNMNVPKPLTEAEKEGLTEEEIAEQETPSATMQLVVYCYKGE